VMSPAGLPGYLCRWRGPMTMIVVRDFQSNLAAGGFSTSASVKPGIFCSRLRTMPEASRPGPSCRQVLMRPGAPSDTTSSCADEQYGVGQVSDILDGRVHAALKQSGPTNVSGCTSSKETPVRLRFGTAMFGFACAGEKMEAVAIGRPQAVRERNSSGGKFCTSSTMVNAGAD